MADGSTLGPSVILSNGSASVTGLTLSHGNHQITAEYSGDGNFIPSTNGLGTTQIIDTAPMALLASYPRAFNSALQISVQDLLTNFTSDIDGDLRTLLWVGTGTNGASISFSGDTIVYQPSATDPNRNTTDYLDYSITDGFSGGMATNKIRITLTGPDPGSQPPILTRISALNSQVLLKFTGIPGIPTMLSARRSSRVAPQTGLILARPQPMTEATLNSQTPAQSRPGLLPRSMEAMNHLNVFAVDIPMIWSRLLRSRPGGELIPYHPDSFPYCIALQSERAGESESYKLGGTTRAFPKLRSEGVLS
jgi:hypothetical protein